MESAVVPRETGSLKDKIIHLKTQIESIEDAPKRDSEVSSDSRLITASDSSPEDVAHQKQAADMQMWWDEAIAETMDLPDGYRKVAVLLVKWADELDDLKTRKETEELNAVFRDRFNYTTQIVELNANKPQQQLRTYMSAFIQKHDEPNNLLIVYYTGHGVYHEELKHLELTATLKPAQRGLGREARCNWNKIQEILKEDDVESDILTILDTCYSSNLAKGGKEETRTFELLSASSIDTTTAAPGDYSFTRVLIDTLIRFREQYGERGFTTFDLNQEISRDERRHDTPSALWSLLQHHHRLIHLAPLKSLQKGQKMIQRLPPPPRAFLTLRFALRNEFLGQLQIKSLTRQLSKAVNNTMFIGLSRIDWLGIKPARTTHFGRAALALFAIAQWKRVVEKRRQERRKIDEVKFPIDAIADERPATTPRKRSRDSSDDSPRSERRRDYSAVSQPPSPPISDSFKTDDDIIETMGT